MNSEIQAVADNLNKLMEHHGHKQTQVAQKSGVSQRTVSNLLNPHPGHSPKTSSVSAVAHIYGLEGWQLQIPGQSLEILLEGQKMQKVVYSYTGADKEGRGYIEHVSEKERAYRVHDRAAGDA